MSAIVEAAFSQGTLNREVHGRLVQNLDSIARSANVTVPMICTPLSKFCTPGEIDYIRQLKAQAQKGLLGMVFVDPDVPMNTKMMAIAGACLRNFINARVMTVQTVLGELKADEMEQPTVLLIPNFHVGKKQGGSLPDWQISMLLGMLYIRQSAGQQTFLAIEGMDELQADYGTTFRQHLEANFQLV